MSLAAGAVMVGAGGLRLAPAASGAEVLSAEELSVVRALAQVLLGGSAFPVGIDDARVPERVDHIVGWMMDATHAAGFRYALRALEWGTFASRGERFSRLPLSDRRDVISAWAEPDPMPRRLALDSFKAVLGMAYFSDERVLSHMGWRGACGSTS